MTRARYKDAHPLNSSNLPAVRDWFAGHGDKRLGFDRTMTVMGAERETLAKIFGKRQQTFTSEFRFDIWHLEHEGLYFWLVSAKSKGTGVEIDAPDVWSPNDECKVISFLEMLYDELKHIEASDEDA
jgi:hypothetical protein